MNLEFCEQSEDAVPTDESDWRFYTEWDVRGQNNRVAIEDIGYYSAPPAERWYRFSVLVYGEGSEPFTPEEGEPYEYYTYYLSPPSAMSAPFWYAGADPLPAPTNVCWNGASMQWTMSNKENVEAFELQVLYDGTEGDEVCATSSYFYSYGSDTTFSESLISVIDEDLLYEESRNYYFKVRALSEDRRAAADSEWAYCRSTCAVNKDAAQLQTPSGLAWDNYAMTWEKEEDVAYHVDLFFQRTQEMTEEEKSEYGALDESSSKEFYEWLYGVSLMESYFDVTEFPRITNNDLDYYDGDYWFRVRAISFDITKQCNSDWSELCGPYRLGDVSVVGAGLNAGGC